MAFIFEKLKIPDVILIKPDIFKDERGFFFESYKRSDFIKNGITEDFIQDNHSFSKKNVFRGLHFQTNLKSQGKLVHVLEGRVIDYVVDIRLESPTYGEVVSCNLSGENNHMIYVPPGLAHGFLALSDVFLTYKCTNEYSKDHESGIHYSIISTMLQIENIIVSEKDKKLPFWRKSI